MSLELKRVFAETKVDGIDEEKRVIRFAGSTEARDRGDEIISVNGWEIENYLKNPVFLWAHDYTQPPVGRALGVFVDQTKKALVFDIEFAGYETYPFADTVFRLYKEGFMNATSVGFIAKEWLPGNGVETPLRTFTRQELLELSAVPVPANQDALRLACSKGVITPGELKDIISWVAPGDPQELPKREPGSSNVPPPPYESPVLSTLASTPPEDSLNTLAEPTQSLALSIAEAVSKVFEAWLNSEGKKLMRQALYESYYLSEGEFITGLLGEDFRGSTSHLEDEVITDLDGESLGSLENTLSAVIDRTLARMRGKLIVKS